MVKKEGSKVYIEGVRQVTWDTGEMCEFASCLVVALQALGEDISYEYVMGTSGVAFRFTINPGQFDFGNGAAVRAGSHQRFWAKSLRAKS